MVSKWGENGMFQSQIIPNKVIGENTLTWNDHMALYTYGNCKPIM